jgi:hypothetical protein
MFRNTRVPVAGALAALALVLAPATASAQAASNPFERGPPPTTQSIEAGRGPYATQDLQVSDLRTPGFGSAVITYPTTTADGTFGAVAIVPGPLHAVPLPRSRDRDRPVRRADQLPDRRVDGVIGREVSAPRGATRS